MNGNTLHMGGGFRTIVRVSGGRLAREEWWEWPSQTAETSVCTVHQLETSYSFLQCIRWATVYHPYTVYGYAIDIHKYTQKRSKISEHMCDMWLSMIWVANPILISNRTAVEVVSGVLPLLKKLSTLRTPKKRFRHKPEDRRPSVPMHLWGMVRSCDNGSLMKFAHIHLDL